MYKDILLPIDLNSEESWKKALPRALELAKAFACRLHVMTVVPSVGMSIVGQYLPQDFEKQAVEKTNEQLHLFVSEFVPDDVKVQHVVANGTIYEEILSVARDIRADLIVMASHRPELKDYLIGPNAARVVRHSPISVLVVRE